MKKSNTLYYLLFVLLILGAFASMAQNSYGMTILGGVAGFFTLLFFYQLFLRLNKKSNKDRMGELEFLCMGIMSLLIALRIFNIHSALTEIIFASAGLTLAFIYLSKTVSAFMAFKTKTSLPSVSIAAYYLSISLFILSLVTFTLLPQPSFVMGLVAFFLLVAFLIISLVKKDTIIEGETFSVFKLVRGFRDQSVILMSLFFVFSLYIGLSTAGILPKLYTDQFPQAYYSLLRDADTRKDQPVNGKYRHDAFKKNYEIFVEKHVRK